MAAIPRELIESELFGHERGHSPAPVQRSAGKFEPGRGRDALPRRDRRHAAGSPTRLLRVLQEGEYMTVGGRTPIKANCPYRGGDPSRAAAG